MLFGTASEIMNKLSTAETLLTDTTTKPTGDLRVTAPIGLGTVWVTQRLREFFELYPDIRIELVLSDEQIAIAMRAADVAIWTSEPQQSDLIRRPLFTMKIHAYASAQYIRRNGAPQSLEALDDHPIISYSGTPAVHLSAIRWLEIAGLDGKPPRKPSFAANSVLAMKYAIRAGLGIGMIPDYLTGDESELVPVLREAQLPTVPVYFVFPEELKSAKKVQVFRDFMVAKGRQWKF
jgi:DNA-binding transcriptional LysR family regulator